MLAPPSAGFRRLLPLLQPHRRSLVAGWLCTLVFVVCWPLLAWLAGQLIPAIGAGDFNRVLRVVGLALSVFLLQKLAQFGQDTLLADPALQVSQELRRRLFARLQRLEFGALEKLSSGDLTYRLTEDADRVGEVIYKTIQDTTPSALQLLVVFGYMVWLDWKLSVGTLLLAPLVAVLVSLFGARVMGAAERSQKQVSELAALLAEAIGGLPLVRAFAAEPWLQRRFDTEIDLHRRARYRTQQLLALQFPVVGFLEAAGILAVLLMGAARIQAGELTGQGFSSYVAALLMLIDPISHLTTNYNEFQQGQASLRRLRQIEQEPVEPPDRADARALGRVQGELVLEGVAFGYDHAQPVLQDLDLCIEPGQVVALVGPSGAGKSTLFSLLLRFNTAQRGRILLDGQDLADLRAAELRRAVALVPQQSNVFSGTVAEAIAFGRDVSREQIRAAARLANADGFIEALPGGYDSRVEERGSNFSGGQLQRLAIARAVLGDPAILLLDEATSALDAESEQAVQRGLEQAMDGRTVLVIAHRLSTVQEADRIVVLEQGRIVDQGSHDLLIGRPGRYRDLCERQLIRGAS
ncbi:ABC transporter ATP-binding protein [Vulcanococcus limneticus]|uniref:ABC transporter ATP-binding protein n=1 Tax=Vulcanococcus limneticus TaxID=2170428 RepID=UPI000B99CA7C|nr:ABC transporter ATP-binding protein [Vulcanococcus limneticus]MCP9793067.1 ABC transporter ATP-binding protein [Vulcanococcus limneticus MW73D5]MCP9895030.1 ABC transporter ATP-binding protein [Vulcanococcus limneticus Candia 3F8]MCP9898470.1 ABC transporter ATP-binding protein [Vulcanococcus limneticus Candia 3B3]